MKTVSKTGKFVVVDLGGGAITLTYSTFVAIYRILLLLLATLPFLVIFGLILGFSVFNYYDNSNVYFAKVEKIYRCDAQPAVVRYSEVFLRPLIALLDAAIDIWNFIGRLNRIFSARALGNMVLDSPILRTLALELLEGIGDSLKVLFQWLVSNPFTHHIPLYRIYREVVMDTIRMVAALGCYLCDSFCSTFEMIADILDSTDLGCAIHNIINGAYFTLLELVKMIVITFFRILVAFFYGWDPYIAQLKEPMQTLRVGVVNLGRAAGNILRIVFCRIFGIVSSLVDTSCQTDCSLQCSTSCLLQVNVTYTECYTYCMPACNIDCRDDYAIQEYEECLDTLLVVEYLADLISSILHAAVALVWQFVWKFLTIIKDGNFGHVAEIDLDIIFDSFRRPDQWYLNHGVWELTPYSRPSKMYIPELVNATSSCDSTYLASELTCVTCAYALLPNDPRHLNSFDQALCRLGTDLDGWLGLGEDQAIFRFIFCRLIGGIIRVLVSFFRIYWKALQALASGGFSGALLYVGYEPNFTDLYHDANYLADAIGMLIPVLAGEEDWYPLQYLIANPLRVILVEPIYALYMLVSRIVNEIEKAISGIDRTPDGYYYVDDLFCIGPHCLSDRYEGMRDLLIVPPDPRSNGTTYCPAFPNGWDPDTNPTGIITFGEAAKWILDLEVLEAFGVHIELPQFGCLVYEAFRVVVTTVDILLHVIFGWASVGDYLYCTNTNNCAPFGPLICDAGRLVECPCTILGDRPEDGGFGLPCVCTFFEALGEFVRRLGGLLWAIFRATGNANIEEILSSFRYLISMQAGSPLYNLADAVSCLLKIFFPKIGDEYQDYCTSGADNHISDALRVLLINVLRIVSFVLGFVAQVAETIIEPTTDSFRDLLEYIVGGALDVAFGKYNSTDPVEEAGILGGLGDFFSCLLGPPGCLANCDNLEDNDNPCLATFINCAAVNLRLVSVYLTNIIMAVYDIFVGIFSGNGTMIGDGFLALFVNFFQMLFAISGLLFDVVGGFVKGIMVAIFGDWIAGIVDAVMFFLEYVFEGMQWLLCVITFGAICPSSSLSDEQLADKFGIHGKVGSLSGLFSRRISMGENGYYSFDELRAAVQTDPKHFSNLFPPGLCQDTVYKLGTDRAYDPGVMDQLFVRYCFGQLLIGLQYENVYGADVVDHELFFDPTRILNVAKDTLTTVVEYTYFKVNGPNYVENWYTRHPTFAKQSGSKKVRGSESKCSTDLLDPTRMDDFECVLEMNGVQESIPRFAGIAMFNRDREFSMNISNLWQNLAKASYENYIRNNPNKSRFGFGNRGMAGLKAGVDTLADNIGPATRKLVKKVNSIDGKKIGYEAGKKLVSAIVNRESIDFGFFSWFSSSTVEVPRTPFDVLGNIAKALVGVGTYSIRKAYDRTANATSTIIEKIRALTGINTQQAYRNRQMIRSSISTLNANFPWLISEDLVPGESFVECDEKYNWCRDIHAVEQQKRRTAKPQSVSRSPVNPVPPLNCLIIDETFDAMFELIDEVFIHPQNFTCGQDNYHWLYWVPVTNDTDVVVAQNGIVARILRYIFSIELPYDVDIVETAVQFILNFNTDPHTDYVGAYFYLRSTTWIPFFSRCSVESVARGTFGVGLWRALEITLWALLLLTMFILILTILTKSATVTFFVSLVPAIITVLTGGFFVVAFLAYGWGLPCTSEPTSLITIALGVPGLPILPACAPPDLLVGVDYIAQHPTMYIPEGFNVDPTKAYLQNCQIEPEFYHCRKFGFNTIFSGLRFWVAKHFPFMYTYFNYSADKRWLVGQDQFDFSVDRPTSEQQYCEYIMSLVTISLFFVGLILLWILILVIAFFIILSTGCCRCCGSFIETVKPSPDESDPAVGTQT